MPLQDRIIRGARIVTPLGMKPADIRVGDGRILEIGPYGQHKGAGHFVATLNPRDALFNLPSLNRWSRRKLSVQLRTSLAKRQSDLFSFSPWLPIMTRCDHKNLRGRLVQVHLARNARQSSAGKADDSFS